jgi:tetratricopeptide (TPR) repeat protein
MRKLFMTVVALMGATTLFAQSDIVATFQQAVANAKAKNYTEAIDQFQSIIDESWDIEEPDANQQKAIMGAKKFIVTCYSNMGNAAAASGDYATAIENFTIAAETAYLYDDIAAMNKNNALVGQVYQAQGADAFNNGDYATAIDVFSKGFAADPRNTDMGLNLARSYFNSDRYEEGMGVCRKIAALNPEKFGEAVETAKQLMNDNTNNQIVKLTEANDFDGIILLAGSLEDAALAQKVIMQAYYNKKDFAKMVELSKAALEAQATDEGRSDIHYLTGVAYYESDNFEAAKAELLNVTAGDYVEVAKSLVASMAE